MSHYTTTLKNYCEAKALEASQTTNLDNYNHIIAVGCQSFWDDPLDDLPWSNLIQTSDVLQFQKDFIKHFYTREIGYETIGLFRLKLDDKLRTILPYYNKLYETTLKQFDFLNDVDYTIESDGVELTETAKNSTTETNKDKFENTQYDNVTDTLRKTGSRQEIWGGSDTLEKRYNSMTEKDGQITTQSSDKYSDTPQNQLQNVEDMAFLTNYRHITNVSAYNGQPGSSHTGVTDTKSGNDIDTTHFNKMITHQYGSNGETEANTKTGGVSNIGEESNTENKTDTLQGTKQDDNTKTVKGKMGNKSYSELLDEYRKTILNIKKMIFNDCEDLFMGVWF